MANLHGLLGAVQAMEWFNLPAFGCGAAMKWPYSARSFFGCGATMKWCLLIRFFFLFSVNILYTCIQYSLCRNIFHCSNAQHAAQKIVSSPCTQCLLFRKKNQPFWAELSFLGYEVLRGPRPVTWDQNFIITCRGEN